jgi:hypothetical protein
MNNGTGSATVERGEVISLMQRSSRRRDYEMRAREHVLGRLRWKRGRRSVAEAEGRGIDAMQLVTRRRQVVAVIGEHGGETLVIDRHRRGGTVIHAVEGHPLSWERTAGRRRWAIREQGETVLSVAASQGLLRSSVRIDVERMMPEETAVLLCLIAGYLALSHLQSAVESAAVAAIVAGSAG